jgi:hypothetical protein
LEPVISSITVERLKRAGEKIAKEIETENNKTGMFEEDKKQVPDIGVKVFDSVEAPKLKVDDKGQISITENETDALVQSYFDAYAKTTDQTFQRELNVAVSSTKKMTTVETIISQYRNTDLVKPPLSTSQNHSKMNQPSNALSRWLKHKLLLKSPC